MTATKHAFTLDRNQVDLDLCLLSGQVFRWRKSIDGTFSGADGQNAARIDPAGNWTTNASKRTWESFFRLDQPNPEAKLIEIDERLASILQNLSGLRMLKPSDPVEVLFSFLCSSNNHLPRIIQMVRYLASLGEPIEGYAETRFPTVDRLADLTEEELRNAGFGYRAKTIPLVAIQIQTQGPDFLKNLKETSYENAWTELQALPGIGPKVADCICLYGLHFGQAVPIDTHFLQAYERLYPGSRETKSLTQSSYLKIGNAMRDKFQNLAGWAQLVMYFDNMRRPRASRKS